MIMMTIIIILCINFHISLKIEKDFINLEDIHIFNLNLHFLLCTHAHTNILTLVSFYSCTHILRDVDFDDDSDDSDSKTNTNNYKIVIKTVYLQCRRVRSTSTLL